MAGKQKGRQYKADFGQITIGDRAAAATLTIGLPEEKAQEAVGDIWANLRKRRLIGRIMLGDDMPNQKNFTDRDVIDGAFDTGRPGFDEDSFSLRVTFDKSEISTDMLSHFAKKSGWIQIDSIMAIPVESKEEDTSPENQAELWTAVPIAQLGLDDKLVDSIFNGGVKTLGRIVKVLNGEDKKFETLDKIEGVAKGRVKTVRSKVEAYFKTAQQDCPLTA